jgi:hypothetical protein
VVIAFSQFIDPVFHALVRNPGKRLPTTTPEIWFGMQMAFSSLSDSQLLNVLQQSC